MRTSLLVATLAGILTYVVTNDLVTAALAGIALALLTYLLTSLRAAPEEPPARVTSRPTYSRVRFLGFQRGHQRWMSTATGRIYTIPNRNGHPDPRHGEHAWTVLLDGTWVIRLTAPDEGPIQDARGTRWQ